MLNGHAVRDWPDPEAVGDSMHESLSEQLLGESTVATRAHRACPQPALVIRASLHASFEGADSALEPSDLVRPLHSGWERSQVDPCSLVAAGAQVSRDDPSELAAGGAYTVKHDERIPSW